VTPDATIAKLKRQLQEAQQEAARWRANAEHLLKRTKLLEEKLDQRAAVRLSKPATSGQQLVDMATEIADLAAGWRRKAAAPQKLAQRAEALAQLTGARPAKVVAAMHPGTRGPHKSHERLIKLALSALTGKPVDAKRRGGARGSLKRYLRRTVTA
jgi:hypothetical protein